MWQNVWFVFRRGCSGDGAAIIEHCPVEGAFVLWCAAARFQIRVAPEKIAYAGAGEEFDAINDSTFETAFLEPAFKFFGRDVFDCAFQFFKKRVAAMWKILADAIE